MLWEVKIANYDQRDGAMYGVYTLDGKNIATVNSLTDALSIVNNHNREASGYGIRRETDAFKHD